MKPIKMDGLRQQISWSNSESRIKILLLEGASYLQASDKTRRQWRATAKRRVAALKA